jgi:hypothetical protein
MYWICLVDHDLVRYGRFTTRVLIVTENNDVNAHLAGVLWLKGMIAYKTSNSNDCFNKVNEWAFCYQRHGTK